MPKSPFEEGFDGKVGDVTEAAAAHQGQQDGDPRQPAPPVKVVKAVAPPLKAPAAVAPPLRTAASPARAVVPPPVVEDAEESLAEGVPADQAGQLGLLLKYLIMKEGREAADAARQEERRKQIQKQRDRNSKEQDSKILLKQARCKHLKGGRKGPKTQNRDHAVYQFQFIDFSTYIRCRICGMKWFPKDTMDYLVRIDKYGKERKISNHTHKGWREALDMCDASTDTMATSERIPQVAPNATNTDAAGLGIDTRLKDAVTGELLEGIAL